MIISKKYATVQETKSFKIVFADNTGSDAIDALATSAGGTWRNTVSNYDGEGHDIGFIDVPAENADYLEEMLDADDNVIEYNEI